MYGRAVLLGRVMLLFVGNVEWLNVLYASGGSVCECVVRSREAVFKRFLCGDTGLVRFGQRVFVFAEVFGEQVCRRVLWHVSDGLQSYVCCGIGVLHLGFGMFVFAEMLRKQMCRRVLRYV